jgi:hypothetical protein
MKILVTDLRRCSIGAFSLSIPSCLENDGGFVIPMDVHLRIFSLMSTDMYHFVLLDFVNG